MGSIQIGRKVYELVFDNRNGWNMEAFRNRYSEVLERYDFIIGDWGYNQLRLKGFFRDNHQKATKDSSFSYAADYINEYCNFGCAYFILEKKQDATSDLEMTEELDELDQDHLAVLDEQAVIHAAKKTGESSLSNEPRKKQKQSTQAKMMDEASNEKVNEKSGDRPKQRNKDHTKGNNKSDHDEETNDLKQESRKEGRSRRREFYQRKAARSAEKKNRASKPKQNDHPITTE